MIDIHAHILPGVDDGPSTIDQALAMAEFAFALGVRTIVATPHAFRQPLHVTPAARDHALQTLQQALTTQQIAITLRPGMECRLVSDLLQQLRQEPLLLLNASSGVFLLELPDDSIPLGCDQFLFEAQMHGLQPLLAHPERNVVLQRQPARLQQLLALGVRLQLSAASLHGVYGWRCKRAAWRWLKQGLIYVVASDAHTLAGYDDFARAWQSISKRFGHACAQRLFHDNAAALLEADTECKPPAAGAPGLATDTECKPPAAGGHLSEERLSPGPPSKEFYSGSGTGAVTPAEQ